MSGELVPTEARGSAGLPAVVDMDLIAAIMAQVGERTARTYESDYRDFARFMDSPTPQAALSLLIALSPGQANATALAYRVHMADRGLSPGTVARRIVAVRTAVKMARTLGLITWALDVPGPKVEAYRDTTGPGLDGWRAMLATAKAEAATREPKAVRNLALLRLLHDLALRRAEAVNLDLSNVDLAEGFVMVLGKGRTALEKLTLSRQARGTLAGWLEVRGSEPGPVFTRLDRAAAGRGRLTGEAVRLIIAGLARRAGLAKRVRPHGLRHQSITQALDQTSGNVRDVQRFSRHRKIETLMGYDDRRVDVAGKIAQLVAGDD